MNTKKNRNKRNSLWKRILSESMTSIRDLPETIVNGHPELNDVVNKYPMRINPYYFGLIKNVDDPIYKQCVPDHREISDKMGFSDPLNEENLSPINGLTHKYPDRVLFLISSKCAMYCRFCNRKRKVGLTSMVSDESIKEGLTYIREHVKITDVLLSGGDPLMLENAKLDQILTELRSIPHVEIIRIGSRIPCTLPQRITTNLVNVLKKHHPLYINTHFNHPDEITPESSLACKKLADAGIPLSCQTVLLKGINDKPEIMKILMKKLIAIRVRPYYLFQTDLAMGTSHFWTPLSKGLEIIKSLQGHISGLCIPHFVVDLPGGGGKVPLLPEYIKEQTNDLLTIHNYMDQEYIYPFH